MIEKSEFKRCYSMVREMIVFRDILNSVNFMPVEKAERAIEGRMRKIQIELGKQFSPYLVAQCLVAYSWKDSSYDRYDSLRWITYQTNKKYGRCEKSWETANRLRIMMLPNDIPF